jgi:hypothetical protein
MMMCCQPVTEVLGMFVAVSRKKLKIEVVGPKQEDQ